MKKALNITTAILGVLFIGVLHLGFQPPKAPISEYERVLINMLAECQEDPAAYEEANMAACENIQNVLELASK
jgi:hypothetical protein